jgi:hypothetical protein
MATAYSATTLTEAQPVRLNSCRVRASAKTSTAPPASAISSGCFRPGAGSGSGRCTRCSCSSKLPGGGCSTAGQGCSCCGCSSRVEPLHLQQVMAARMFKHMVSCSCLLRKRLQWALHCASGGTAQCTTKHNTAGAVGLLQAAKHHTTPA